MKTYTESEVQGPGRRYWFRTVAARTAFAAAKRRAGYAVFSEGMTVWASRSKKWPRSAAVDEVMRGGIDPHSMGGR